MLSPEVHRDGVLIHLHGPLPQSGCAIYGCFSHQSDHVFGQNFRVDRAGFINVLVAVLCWTIEHYLRREGNARCLFSAIKMVYMTEIWLLSAALFRIFSSRDRGEAEIWPNKGSMVSESSETSFSEAVSHSLDQDTSLLHAFISPSVTLRVVALPFKLLVEVEAIRSKFCRTAGAQVFLKWRAKDDISVRENPPY